MLLDYHLHTSLCRHAEGSPREYAAVAAALGLSEIGFSDHIPVPRGYDSRFRMDEDEFPTYRKLVEDASAVSRDMTVRFGIEADWVPGRMDEVYAFLEEGRFDYVIGSIHYVEDFPHDNPEFMHLWNDEGTADRTWEGYAEAMLAMVRSGRFNILGHFDLPKKFGHLHSDMRRMLSSFDEILEAAGKAGMAIEVNTSGLRKPVKELYPSLEILKLARRRGLMLTLGSDAHRPDEVAANFADALELARAAGFSEICSFSAGTPSLHPLG